MSPESKRIVGFVAAVVVAGFLGVRWGSDRTWEGFRDDIFACIDAVEDQAGKAATTLNLPPPHPCQRDKRIANMLTWVVSSVLASRTYQDAWRTFFSRETVSGCGVPAADC